MKKIILAVASVLALGLVVGCKQQIEGSLNVTSTNFNKNLDALTTKTYVYSVSGTATQTTLDHAMVVTKVKSGSTLGSRNRSDLYQKGPRKNRKILTSDVVCFLYIFQ